MRVCDVCALCTCVRMYGSCSYGQSLAARRSRRSEKMLYGRGIYGAEKKPERRVNLGAQLPGNNSS